MKKTIELTLQELYNKPKITPSIEQAILAKEDFSFIQENYCNKVCKLKCKSYNNVNLDNDRVDVLIVQDHRAYRDGYKDGDKLERTYRTIIEELCRRNLQGLTYRVTNSLKCNLQEEDLNKGNKPPTFTIQSKCHPYLKKEIELTRPRVLISLGTNSTKAIGIKNKSNYTNRGEIVDNVVLTLHPKVTTMIRQNAAGKMWGPDFWQIIDQDFAKAGRLARGELVIPSVEEGIERQKPNIFVTKSMADVLAAIKELLSLSPTKLLSYDIETTGLDRYAPDAKLLCVQFGYRLPSGQIRAIVFPLWHRVNTWYDPQKAWEQIVAILLGPNPKMGHNVKYDILYTHAVTGVRVNNVVMDTMLALHNLNSGVQGTYGLKIAVWDHLADLGIGGYEDLLPKLTKPAKETEDEDESDEGSRSVH